MVMTMTEQLWVLWWDDICETHGVLGSGSDWANDNCFLVVLYSETFASVALSMEISAVNFDSDLISVVVHHLDGDSD